MTRIRPQKRVYSSPRALWAIAIVVSVLLYLPLLTVLIESLLEHRPDEGAVFVGLLWYRKMLHNSGLAAPLLRSIFISFCSTVIATALGASAALFMTRRPFKGKFFWEGLFMLPLIMPDLILGMASLVLFVLLQLPLGVFSVILAHTTFAFSYVYILIKNRLQGLDLRLEEAASDLGALPHQVFWYVTWPQCWPAVLGAALSAFALSFDDFLISFFTAGVSSDTLPMRLYAMVKFGFDGETYALSSSLLLISFPIIVIALLLQNQGQSMRRISRNPSR